MVTHMKYPHMDLSSFTITTKRRDIHHAAVGAGRIKLDPGALHYMLTSISCPRQCGPRKLRDPTGNCLHQGKSAGFLYETVCSALSFI